MSGASSSQIASAVVAVVVFLVVLAYIAGFYFLSQYAKQHPNTRPKAVVIEKYAPFLYIFLALCSIVETAISIWILIVYRNSSDYPNAGARSGICLTLFSSCWTFLFSTLFAVVIVYPILPGYPVASLVSQAGWTLISWSSWVACTAILNGALPLATSGVCLDIAHCSQLQTLFAFSVVELLVLTFFMLALGWLLWKTRASR